MRRLVGSREVIDEALGMIDLEVNHAGEVAVVVGVVRVEALGDKLGVVVVFGEDDRLAQPVATRHRLASRHQVFQHLLRCVGTATLKAVSRISLSSWLRTCSAPPPNSELRRIIGSKSSYRPFRPRRPRAPKVAVQSSRRCAGVLRDGQGEGGLADEVAQRDSLVGHGAQSGALGGIRTPDTWFRRPDTWSPSSHVWSLLVLICSCRETRKQPFVPFSTKQSQPAHGQLMVKDARTVARE